jgi:hypothetical protein
VCFCHQATLPLGKKWLLIIVVTDGIPSDGTREDVERTLRAKPKHTHISFAECTDQAQVRSHPAHNVAHVALRRWWVMSQDMEWLDELDKSLENFDNTDDCILRCLLDVCSFIVCDLLLMFGRPRGTRQGSTHQRCSIQV